jgi:hypothetical protein
MSTAVKQTAFNRGEQSRDFIGPAVHKRFKIALRIGLFGRIDSFEYAAEIAGHEIASLEYTIAEIAILEASDVEARLNECGSRKVTANTFAIYKAAALKVTFFEVAIYQSLAPEFHKIKPFYSHTITRCEPLALPSNSS